MLTAGEFRYTGRSDAIGEAKLARIAHVCRVLGVEGLHGTLISAREHERVTSVPEALRTGIHASYSLASRAAAVALPANNAVAAA